MASHTATGEWQSFEVRMRRRRAERLLLRADVALESGFLDDARAAVAEARRLSSGLPEIAEMEARIERASHPQPLAARRPARRAWAAAAVLVASGLTAFGWLEMRPPAPALEQPAPSPANSATPAPAPAQPAAPSIKIETESVPPVVTRGLAPPPKTPDEPRATQSARANTPPPETPAEAAPQPAPQPASPPPSPVSNAIDQTAARVLDAEVAPASLPDVARAASTSREPARSAAEPAPPPPVVEGRAETKPKPSAPEVTDADLVRRVLDRYADAYTRLDADAAQSIWPSVNHAALARAFNGLAEQKIAFADCAVDVQSSGARAVCSGSATWQPKVGGSGPRTDARHWAFDLQKAGDGWVIRDARVQNR
jgi:hypothetical protein